MNLQNLFLTVTMLLSGIQLTYAATPSDTSKKIAIHSGKSLTLSSMFKPLTQNQDFFDASSLSYTFSGSISDTINYVRLCKATDGTCSSCNIPFRVINSGTPIPYSTSGTTYGVSPTSIAAYLQGGGLTAGSYNIGVYVQSTSFNCSSSSAYCSTNQGTNTQLLCMQATYDGTNVTTLTQSDNGQALLGTSAVPFAYVCNSNSVSTVSKCPVNSDGTLGTCTDSGNSGTAFNNPFGIAFNPPGTFAYVSNFGSTTVSKCPINSDGTFGVCADSGAGAVFNQPAGIAFNSSGNFAYVINTNNTVSTCPVDSSGAFGTCTNSGVVATLSAPIGIAINQSSTFAYIGNQTNSTVSKCPLSADGTFGVCTDSGAGAVFNGTRYPILNHAGTIAYVTSADSNTVFKCPVNNDGTFGTCADSGVGAVFSSPRGIVINPSGTIAYVTNRSANTASKCTINPDGTFGTCTASGAGAAFNVPQSITLAAR